MNSIAHIIVDFQNDFVAKKWALSVDAAHLWPIISSINDEFKKCAYNVFATKDWHPIDHSSFAINHDKEPTYTDNSWPVHCVKDTWWSNLHHSIGNKIDRIYHKGNNPEKEQYSWFGDDNTLNHLLKQANVDHVYISWVATDYCVWATALDAKWHWYEVSVITDAIKWVNSDTTQRTLEEMKNTGIHLITSSELFEELKKITS